jgi:hypothetical protein
MEMTASGTIIAGTAALFAAIALVSGCATSGPEGPSLSAEPGQPTPAATTDPTRDSPAPGIGASPDATPAAPDGPDAWTGVELERGARTSPDVFAVEAGPFGLVALGGRQCVWPATAPDRPDPDDCYGLLWTSQDGRAWERLLPSEVNRIGVMFPASGPEPGFVAAGGGAEGIVVVGYGAHGDQLLRLMWRLRGAQALERVSTEAFGRVEWGAVAASPDRYVIVGTDVGGGVPRAAAWSSADGSTWTRAEDGPQFDIGGYVDTGEHPSHGGPRDVVWADGTFIATGMACDEIGSNCRTAVWTSPDGAAWTRLEVMGAPGGLRSVTAGPAGVVAVGSTCGDTCTGLAMWSPDGSTWETAEIAGLADPTGVAATPGGFIVVGRGEGPRISASTSVDGLEWTPVEGLPPLPQAILIRDIDVAVVGGRPVIVASTEGDEIRGYALVGPAQP